MKKVLLPAHGAVLQGVPLAAEVEDARGEVHRRHKRGLPGEGAEHLWRGAAVVAEVLHNDVCLDQPVVECPGIGRR